MVLAGNKKGGRKNQGKKQEVADQLTSQRIEKGFFQPGVDLFDRTYHQNLTTPHRQNKTLFVLMPLKIF